MLKGGVIMDVVTPEQALTSRNKNLITRALGVEDAVRLEINEHRVEPGDLYLMCSDGLSDMVGYEVMTAMLGGTRTLPQKAAQLVAAANHAGGRDNISVLLVQARDDTGKRGLLSRMPGK